MSREEYKKCISFHCQTMAHIRLSTHSLLISLQAQLQSNTVKGNGFKPPEWTLKWMLVFILCSFLSLFSPLRDSATVPMGPGVKTGVGKRNSYSLLYNEFIVYNPAQTRMRYLLRIKFNYSSLWWGCAGKRGMAVWNLGISEGFPSDEAGEETSLVIWLPSSWPWMFHLVTI